MARPDSRWMPLDWGDYWRDTPHLRGTGHGAYLNLIGAYWSRGGALPTDDAALEAMSKCTTKEWRSVRGQVLAFFIERDGHYHHNRIDRELERAKTIYEKRSAAARSTNAKRDANRDGDRDGDRKQCDTATELTPTPPLPQHSPNGENTANAVLPDKPKRDAAKTEIPADWQPTAKDVTHATDRGVSLADIPATVEHFVNHHRAKGNKFKDHSSAWRTWIANRKNFERPKSGGNGQSRVGVFDTIARLKAETGAGGPDNAGTRMGRGANGLQPAEHDDGAAGPGPYGNSPVIDADDAERVLRAARGTEVDDGEPAGSGKRSGGPNQSLYARYRSLSSRRGPEGSDHPSDNEQVVADVGGVEREAGTVRQEAQAVDGSDFPPIPEFMKRSA